LRAPQRIETELMHTYAASRLQAFWLLRMPSALPYLFPSLRVAIAAGLVIGLLAGMGWLTLRGGPAEPAALAAKAPVVTAAAATTTPAPPAAPASAVAAPVETVAAAASAPAPRPAAAPKLAAVVAKPSPKETRPAREAQPAKASGGSGSVRIAVSPWGNVEVNGTPVGTTPPLNELTLPEGKHQIVIRNADFPPYSATISVAPGQAVNLKHKFGS
ncbi:PEGA domain-containing protein, partial [Piscinibacter sp.]|uniref:PEGA domain-containing protein n=1 Tax=Piscinibacter sp. TaxID=1903157 RepID=UPI003784E0A8